MAPAIRHSINICRRGQDRCAGTVWYCCECRQCVFFLPNSLALGTQLILFDFNNNKKKNKAKTNIYNVLRREGPVFCAVYTHCDAIWTWHKIIVSNFDVDGYLRRPPRPRRSYRLTPFMRELISTQVTNNNFALYEYEKQRTSQWNR